MDREGGGDFPEKRDIFSRKLSMFATCFENKVSDKSFLGSGGHITLLKSALTLFSLQVKVIRSVIHF